MPANAISEFDQSGLSLGQVNKVIINGTWCVLEFPAAYDPCVCQATSFLQFEPQLVSVETLELKIEGTGTSEAVYENNSGTNEHIGNAIGAINDVNGTFESAYKLWNSLEGFTSKLNAMKTVETLFTELPDWYPQFGAAAKIAGFFIGAKGASTPKLVGFNHDFRFEGVGTLSESADYEPKAILTPGSYYDVPQTIESLRPVYDNPLGLVAVLVPPRVEVATADAQQNVSYRFIGPLAYTVNPFSGLGEPTRLEGALVWQTCNNRDNFYATPSIPLNCLSEYNVITGTLPSVPPSTYFEGNHPTCLGPPVLQLTAFFGDELIFSARYKVDLVNADYSMFDVPGITLGDSDLSEALVSCTSPAVPPQVSDLALRYFCDNVYDPGILKRIENPADTDVAEEAGSKDEAVRTDTRLAIVFPNPFQDEMSIRFSPDLLGQRVDLELYDAMGQVVWQQRSLPVIAGEYTFTAGLAGLPPGIYHLRITAADAYQTLSISKN
jgi:hypothetical protein